MSKFIYSKCNIKFKNLTKLKEFLSSELCCSVEYMNVPPAMPVITTTATPTSSGALGVEGIIFFNFFFIIFFTIVPISLNVESQ